MQFRGVQSQVNNFVSSFSDTTKIITLKTIAKLLIDSLQTIVDTLINSKIIATADVLRYPMQLFERYCALKDFVRMADAAPTKQALEVFNELNGRLTPELKRVQYVFEKKVQAFNDAVKQQNLNVVVPSRAINDNK